jgi:hypothetical protein
MGQGKKIDWTSWHDFIVDAYVTRGRSYAETLNELSDAGFRCTITSLRTYMKSLGVQRTKSEAGKLAFQQGKVKGWQNSMLHPRVCKHCGSQYMARSRNHTWCDVCVPTSQAAYRMRVYGISAMEFDAMLQAQDGKCAICRKSFVSLKKCYVDHDHKTGKHRDLLCPGCNTGVAWHENVELAASINSYLEKHRGSH